VNKSSILAQFFVIFFITIKDSPADLGCVLRPVIRFQG
jgi:hypothetical protein